MKVELSAVQVGSDQTKYPNARFVICKTEAGVQFPALMLPCAARTAGGQPQIEAALAAVPVELFITDGEADFVLTQRSAA